MLTKYGLVGSSSLLYQGLICTQTVCNKLGPELRNINVPLYNTISQQYYIFGDENIFDALDELNNASNYELHFKQPQMSKWCRVSKP